MATPSKALMFGFVCALAWQAAYAQSNNVKPKLKLVVILSRHGVRSPTWTQDRLDSYSALPWPKWNVPPADLTSRGYELIKRFGTYDRAALAQQGLFAPTGCADAKSAYIWADTDERTVKTGDALSESLFPGCSLATNQLPSGGNDPLFHPTNAVIKPAAADAAFSEFAARVQKAYAQDSAGKSQESLLIGQLNRLLLGCAPEGACTPVRQPENALLPSPPVVPAPVRGKGDHIVDLQGPLPLGSTFAEDLLLEYADGMPLAQVGWGHVDEAELGRLLALHSGYFELMHRTPSLARIEASNMLFHIVRTLEQGEAGKTVAGAMGPAGTKLVLLAGHDTNLAGVAALLGVHWDLDGRHDDTPPGTELAFELWQNARGAYEVRVAVASQTLRQLRDLAELTPANPPARATLLLPGCAKDCAWSDFARIADAAIDKNDILP